MANILAVRSFFLNGQPVEKGAVRDVDPLVAGEIVSTGRAQYVNDWDQIETMAAVQRYKEKQFPLSGDRKSFWERKPKDWAGA